MRMSRTDPGASRIVTLDIETTHYKPARGEVVSVGVAAHERGRPADAVTYHLIHRNGAGEAETITRGLDVLAEAQPDVLVSYHGKGFDLDFLRRRLHRLDQPADAFRMPPAEHIDLFVERQRQASQRDEKWPTLEECLAAYEVRPARTVWGGEAVTNTRFGEELGPAYLRAVRSGDAKQQRGLRAVIDHYLTTDLEANLCLYYADIGEAFAPVHLGTKQAFPGEGGG